MQVGAFINHIEAKIGKTLTNQQAQILIELVKKL
jgi:quercetin dioxygenase-like cupin family protein